MNSPKISIITVVYNNVETIADTIKSVLAQSYTPIEYIIVDGLSTDGTLEVINQYRNKISHIVSARDQGIYDAMNKGIALATGDLIGIINSDDWYEENAVALVVDAYQQNPGASIFHGLLRYVDPKIGTIQVIGHHHTFLQKGMIEHPTCFVHKRVYEKLQYNTLYKVVADYDLMLRARQNGFEFHFISEVIANFRSGGISETFASARETLALQRKYGLINLAKQYLLTAYFWLKRNR